MLRLAAVCWNHIDGVAVWWSWCVSPYYVSVDNSLDNMALCLTPCRSCCGEFVANV